MSFLRTGLLALLALGLGLYLYFVEIPDWEASTAPDRLVAFDPTSVTGIDLTYPGQDRIRLERGAGGPAAWRMTAPLQTEADGAVIDSLLTAIVDVEVERRIAAGDARDLSSYGLEGDGATARVELRTADGSSLPPIIVGNTTPVGFSAFVRRGDREEVLVTPLLFHTGIRKSLFDLREKTVVGMNQQHIIAIEIDGSFGKLRLERAGSRWIMQAPRERRVDDGAIRGLLGVLGGIEAAEFVDEPNEEELGLDPPFVSVLVEAGQRKRRLYLGAKTPDETERYYFEVDGVVAKVDAQVMRGLNPNPLALADRTLLPCDPKSAVRVDFTGAEAASFSLISDGEQGWRLEPEGDRAVNPGAVDRVLANLAVVRAAEIVAENVGDEETRAEYGLAAPSVTILVTNAKGEQCGVSVGRGASGDDAEASADPTYYFQRRGDSDVLTGKGHVFSRLDLVADDLLLAAAQSD